MKSYETIAKRITLSLLVAAFAAPAVQAANRPDDRAGPLGVGTAVSAPVVSIRPDDRAGPLGIGLETGSQPTAALRPDDRPGIRGVGAPQPTIADPVQRINAQERARISDPALYGVPASTAIQIVEPGGFDWGDAGIGAAFAVALMLLALGTTLVVRHGQVRSA